MSNGEPDKVVLTCPMETAHVKELIHILSFEHTKALTLDAAAKREPSDATKFRASLLSSVRVALIRAGRADVWNSALETLHT